ncbi:hypothetical protein [Vibrio sp. SCSIO 43136]|uniref:hypothetical protein n=1 Tax=Vibrio sp. SCSIO 43136 TaxID=2819101 RepID=UPI0020764B0A|nr:hypothetical protein [Vibrio sp. SCSIO 43136]USD68166.1 hypothetical protein J4N39_18520 [Vibrio sp. SCSIO 43136]
MPELVFWIEKLVLLTGILSVIWAVKLYGQRSSDWTGVVTMFYKRIPLDVSEYKWYRLGIALIFFAVVLRILTLTFWP